MLLARIPSKEPKIASAHSRSLVLDSWSLVTAVPSWHLLHRDEIMTPMAGAATICNYRVYNTIHYTVFPHHSTGGIFDIAPGKHANERISGFSAAKYWRQVAGAFMALHKSGARIGPLLIIITTCLTEGLLSGLDCLFGDWLRPSAILKS